MNPEEREAHVRELRKFLRELKRPQREADLRAGRVRPKNRAEMEIFAKDILGEQGSPSDPLAPSPERARPPERR